MNSYTLLQGCIKFPRGGGIESSCWGRKSSGEEVKGRGRREGKGREEGKGNKKGKGREGKGRGGRREGEKEGKGKGKGREGGR